MLRAVVENANNALMPGRYVRTRIRLDTRHNAVVVPNVAVSDGEQQTQVFVVGDDGKAKAVKVQLGPDVENGRLVESGLSGGEKVIVSGLGQLKPGAAVKVKSEQEEPANAPGQGTKDDAGKSQSNDDDQPVGQSAEVRHTSNQRLIASHAIPTPGSPSSP